MIIRIVCDHIVLSVAILARDPFARASLSPKPFWYYLELYHLELLDLEFYRLEWYGTEGIVYLLKVYTEKGCVGGRWGSEAGQAGQASQTR